MRGPMRARRLFRLLPPTDPGLMDGAWRALTVCLSLDGVDPYCMVAMFVSFALNELNAKYITASRLHRHYC